MSDIVERLRASVTQCRTVDRSELLSEAGGMGELLRFLALFILIVSGWLLSASLAFRLHFANDTIRNLRANAATLTADEREAVEVTVEILKCGEVPKIFRPHLTKTLRGLLERL